MKNLLIAVVLAAILTACNTNTGTTRENSTSTHAAYAPSEGDVSYKEGKVMVWRNGEWEEANNDVHLSGGIVVNRRGEVIKGDKVIMLDDGEVVDKSGRFFDKAGNVIEDAWNTTKKGAKKAGEEVKEVFRDDDRDNKKDKDDKY